MPNKTPIAQDLRKIYRALFQYFGPQNWWPGETAFEVIIGAVLTQNTNWSNVEKAIANLKREGLLSIDAMHRVSLSRLASAIKPAGYFNVKASRLKNVVGFIVKNYGGSLHTMNSVPVEELRRQWLLVNGVGPETADSILLYALGRPVFVVDAYTKRFMMRHNMAVHDHDYARVQKIFMDTLDADPKLFNEYHALIVRLGKDFCKTRPRCEECPLRDIRYNIKERCSHCHRTFWAGEEHFVLNKNTQNPVCGGCYGVFLSRD